ncbi:MAG: RNA polymerase sigma factor [Rhodospirillales bacterium]
MSDAANLVTQAIPHLRRYARALTRDADQADDLVQDALERAWRHLGSWRGTDIRPWLFTILHNVYVNALRKRRREPAIVPLPLNLAGPNDAADVRLDLRALEAAIARLPEEWRQVLLLVGLEQLGYQEVAGILGIPLGTVMSRLFRARRQLRALMRGEAVPGGATDE